MHKHRHGNGRFMFFNFGYFLISYAIRLNKVFCFVHLHVARNPVFGVSDKAVVNPAYSATETSLNIESLNDASLKGAYQGFTFFIANSFYMSDFMYLLRTQIIFHNVQ